MVRPLLKYPVIPHRGRANYRSFVRWNGVFYNFDFTMTPDSMYWCTNDAQSGSSVTDLIQLYETQFRAATGASAAQFRMDIDPHTQHVVVSGSLPYRLRWNNINTPNQTKSEWFGFHRTELTMDSGGIASSSFVAGGTWYPSRNPFPDSYDRPIVNRKTVRCRYSGVQRTFAFTSGSQIRNQRRMEWGFEPNVNIITERAGTVPTLTFESSFRGTTPGPSGTFQELHRSALSVGLPVRYYSDALNVQGGVGNYTTYKSWTDSEDGWDRIDRGSAFYGCGVDLMSVTTDDLVVLLP